MRIWKFMHIHKFNNYLNIIIKSPPLPTGTTMEIWNLDFTERWTFLTNSVYFLSSVNFKLLFGIREKKIEFGLYILFLYWK